MMVNKATMATTNQLNSQENSGFMAQKISVEGEINKVKRF